MAAGDLEVVPANADVTDVTILNTREPLRWSMPERLDGDRWPDRQIDRNTVVDVGSADSVDLDDVVDVESKGGIGVDLSNISPSMATGTRRHEARATAPKGPIPGATTLDHRVKATAESRGPPPDGAMKASDRQSSLSGGGDTAHRQRQRQRRPLRSIHPSPSTRPQFAHCANGSFRIHNRCRRVGDANVRVPSP
jgi:hypothetical protein